MQNNDKRKGVIFTNTYFSAKKDGFPTENPIKKAPKVRMYCDHCGFAIYSDEEALVINDSDDIIHVDCWEDYALEHMFDFCKPASSLEC